MRATGFDMPLNPLQLISWFVFFYNFTVFFLVDMIVLAGHTFLVLACSTSFIAFSIGVLIFAVEATRTDPTDPTIRMQKQAEAKG